MDPQTLLAALDFGRTRLLGTIDSAEKYAAEKRVDPRTLLAWRPGPGRAHVAWQAAHCAATLDKYLNVALLARDTPADEKLVNDFGGGSTPSDENVPDFATCRRWLEAALTPFRAFVAAQTPESLEKTVRGPGPVQRKLGDAIVLLIWHEAHHQGQIHLLLNLFKAAHP